jgi:hypothetical protein
MITLTRVKQATSQFIKVLRFGFSDVQTANNVAPWGVDSKPVKETLAVHVKTSQNSKGVIIGYVNNSDKTNEGETRIYATNNAGVEVFSILLKNNGTVEFGGNTDNFVRYSELNSALQTFVTNLNSKLTTGFAAVPFSWVPETLNISASKISEIKTS